ncbi:MAG: BON domain-containing protein [Acidobacteria bacterium]|nr:BON domain-containing protein [Acidobacteriota bacterium]
MANCAFGATGQAEEKRRTAEAEIETRASAARAVPPIHIIVKNGRATLKGVVATEMDRQLAYTAASSVPGLFQVTNELQIEP